MSTAKPTPTFGFVKLIIPEQLAIVESTSDKILAICGPGTGKTRTLIDRIFKLIERGAKASEIVCITYTRAAAAEIQKRLGNEYVSTKCEVEVARDFSHMKVPVVTTKPGLFSGYCGTLHAFAFQMLCQHGTVIGLPANLSVIDDEQREGILESIMLEMGVKCSVKKVLPLLSKPELIDNHIGSKSKEQLVAVAYHQTLRINGLLDFDTILHYFLKLIQKITDWPFNHLLWDEFHDSSDMDFQIMQAMPCETKFLVADFDQQIYSFRGSDTKKLLNLALHASPA